VIGGVRLRVGRHLSRPILRAIRQRRYEAPELSLVQRLLQPTDRVLELGTGLGLIATFCAKALGSDNVMTYEANPALEKHIRHTFASNAVSPALRMMMAGTADGTSNFYVSADFWTSSTLDWTQEAVATRVTVRCVNDDIASFQPTVLIIDIEGGELSLVPTLQLSGIRALVMEVHPPAIGPDGVQGLKMSLLARGFELTADGDDWHCLFIRTEPERQESVNA
jgi:FkbM family methyltransferase